MKRLAYWVLSGTLVLAACGDDDGGGGGADAGDAPDTGDVLPTEGTCALVVGGGGVRNGGPQNLAGIPVVFSTPDGTTLHVGVTDAKGEASFDSCVRGTSITFVFQGFFRGPITGPPQGFELYTYAGANPGDTFYFGGGQPSADPPSYLNYNITLSADLSGFPMVDGTYTVSKRITACSGLMGPPPTFQSGDTPPFLPGSVGQVSCLGQNPADLDVLVWLTGSPNDGGFNPFTNGRYAYAFAKDVPVTLGTELEVNEAAITLGGWMGLHTDNVHSFSPNMDAVNHGWGTTHYVDGRQMDSSSTSESFDLGESPQALVANSFRGLPAGFGDTTVTTAYAQVSRGDPSLSINEARFGPFTTTPVSDLTDALPRFENVVVTDLASGRPVIRWFLEGGFPGEIAYFRTNIRSVDRGFNGGWTLLTNDPSAGEWRSPDLPADIAALLQEPGLVVEPATGAISDADYADYAEIVGTEGFFPFYFSGCSGPPPNFSLGGEGRVRSSSINFSGGCR